MEPPPYHEPRDGNRKMPPTRRGSMHASFSNERGVPALLSPATSARVGSGTSGLAEFLSRAFSPRGIRSRPIPVHDRDV
jgi:hypothetical protein